MNILIAIDTQDQKINKAGFELATYANLVAAKSGGKVHALVIGQCTNVDEFAQYGADEIHKVSHEGVAQFDSQVYTQIIKQVAQKFDAKLIIVRHNANGKSLLGRLAIALQAGSVSGVNALPNFDNGFVVSKSAYSGKAIAHYSIQSDIKVISLAGNTLQPQASGKVPAVAEISLEVPSPKITVVSRDTITGHVPLPEAEKVVSAGRGMKGPENWGIIEDLAAALGATTACSRPVADTGWRPHHEHVGQTGVAIKPNLYIAIGISGAIQHLAGVNNSKTIVVINKDPEAPFFKAADYGVVGDLFEVVPKLTEALKNLH
jgi:electron transfer flavoprotein alpha subunit